MKKHLFTLALLIATPLAAMAANTSDDSTQPSSMAPSSMSSSSMASSSAAQPSSKTTDFIKNAAIGGKFEVESSKLALQKSQNDDVKQFAQMMIDDHVKADHQLKDTVKSENIDSSLIPTTLDSKHQRMLDKLKSASADDFDKDYIKEQNSAHKETISVFKKYAKKGDDQALKGFATQTLPTLNTHLQHVKELKSNS